MDSLQITKPVVFGIIGGVLLFSSVIYLVNFERSTEDEPEVDSVVEVADPVDEPKETGSSGRVIGSSVMGRDIEVQTFNHVEGDEERAHVVFVGGIHGGYEWNSVLLAYELIDHFEENPDIIPESVSVSVVPSANPDGVEMVTGKTGRFTPDDIPSFEETIPGRFNANGVDLNRNFDCNWQSESTWQGEVIDAGEEAFSEPEARAIRDLVSEYEPDAVIFWHSAAGAVFGSECNEGILPGTIDVMNVYAEASGYPAIESFDFYEITGDAEGWLATLGIPSITIEFTTHDDMEWEKNLAGVLAVLEYFGETE